MTRLLVAHTADLDAATLRASRDLLHDVFDDMTPDDWEHCLGGMHALVVDGGDVVGHAAVVQRRLVLDGRAMRTGYVEGVAVRRDARRAGHGSALMGAVERVIRAAYDLGALGTTDEAEPMYLGRGWQRWQGRLFAMTPDGVQRTAEEEGAVLVLPAGAAVDLTGDLVCDWRSGDVW